MPAPLRVAVDARVVATDLRGIGRYARAILRRLAPRDDVAFTLLIPELFPARRRAALARALGTRRFGVARRVPRGTDVTWFPANGTFFESRAPVVATLHDAVPFRYPNADVRAREREQRPFLETVRTARAFIAVSDFGKSELCAVFRIEPERIATIHHGIDPAFSAGEAGPLADGLVPGSYLLFVGDPAEPRKNFRVLRNAHRAAWPDGDGPQLRVISKLGDDVQGGAESLISLYRGALAVAVPSYHETFGFPLLEAMACGAPALASKASSLPEVGGDAALWLPPHDESAWSEALRQVAQDAELRARLRERGLERAAAFDWERSAAAHLELFRQVAAAR